MSRILVLASLLCQLILVAGAVAEPLPLPELIRALQGGGHIIYMRHGATDQSQQDENPLVANDCGRQRNLSVAGREQSTDTGLAFKALEIPVGEVFTSSYCRTRDTAKLAFGYLQVEPQLNFSISKNKEEAEYLATRLRDMMMRANTHGHNVVFVGHSSNLRDGLGIWPKPEGVVVVFHKHGTELVYDGMIKPGEWPKP